MNENVGVFFHAAITYTMSSVAIVLAGLNHEITMAVSGAIPSDELPSMGHVDCAASINVDYATVYSIFQFHSDSVDITNAAEDDLKFTVVSDDSVGFGAMDTNVADAVVADASGIFGNATNKSVSFDFVRYLAQELFGTHYGVDLFTNEDELVANIQLLCGKTTSQHVWGNIIAVAKAANTAGAQESSELDSNICCRLFNQVIKTAPGRFDQLAAVPAGSGDYYVPLLAGDSITFILSISPASGQESITGGATAIAARLYGITLNLVTSTP